MQMYVNYIDRFQREAREEKKYARTGDATASLGAPAEICRVFVDFQRFLYEKVRAT